MIFFLISFISCFNNELSNAFHPGFQRRYLSVSNDVPLPRFRAVRDDGDDEDCLDIEATRRRLEDLIRGDVDGSSSTAVNATTISSAEFVAFRQAVLSPLQKEVSLPSPPPLTSSDRDRRSMEIQLIRQLIDSDEPLIFLWDLWYSERGPRARDRLRETDQLMGDPRRWKDCEALLWSLVQDYGVYFCEAVNRLATLYFLQGRYEESRKLCRAVLQLKPWHVGALAGIVQVCVRAGDRTGARLWADRRLPSLPVQQGSDRSLGPSSSSSAASRAENTRRQEWVKCAIADAEMALKLAEDRVKQALGKPEDYY